jgi:pimeloyl-ACP methyl ester carboxylesterase
MSFSENATVVLVHGAWADGSSWQAIVGPLEERGFNVIAAPIPLTSLSDDAAALRRTIAQTQGPLIVAGHAYGGAVIATANDERVKALVYVVGLAPDEGETVAQVFYRDESHPKAPQLAPDGDGFIWMPDEGFANAFAQNATDEQIALSKSRAKTDRSQEYSGSSPCTSVEVQANVVSRCRRRPNDQSQNTTLHGRTHEGDGEVFRG